MPEGVRRIGIFALLHILQDVVQLFPVRIAQ